MKLSLHVVPPPRDAPALPALTVRLSEPMLRFRCNQKGCCCSGWDIPFRLEDFLRLHDRLPDGERAALRRGIQLVLEKGDREGEQIERLDESAAPLRIHEQAGAFGDPGFDLRVAHTSDKLGGRIGDRAVEVPALDRIRALSLEAFSASERPVWRTLAALAHAYRRLRIGNEAAFEVVEPEDPQPFVRFLGDSIAAHGPDLLAASVARYRRFIHAIDAGPLLAADRLPAALREWQPALERWVAPEEDALRPLASRWLAHRFAIPMLKGRSELRESCDGIVHLYAVSLRYAAAFGETLQRPVDRTLYKVAIGSAEFFYRSLNLPREVLPWFAAG